MAKSKKDRATDAEEIPVSTQIRILLRAVVYQNRIREEKKRRRGKEKKS